MIAPRALVVVLLLLPSCGRAEEQSPETLAYLAAVEKQNSGAYDAALREYRQLLKTCEDRRIRARAELGLAQIETAFARRDRALERLQELPKELDRRTLPSVEQEIEEIVLEFAETPFEDEVRDVAHAARKAARDRRKELEKVERDVAVSLMDRGDFNAALEYLRQLESERAPEDLREVAELLAMVRLRSEEEAATLLSRARELAASDPVGAAAILDEAIPKFVGTRAHAGLLIQRKKLAEKAPLSTPKQAVDEPESGKGDG